MAFLKLLRQHYSDLRLTVVTLTPDRFGRRTKVYWTGRDAYKEQTGTHLDVALATIRDNGADVVSIRDEYHGQSSIRLATPSSRSATRSSCLVTQSYAVSCRHHRFHDPGYE